MPATVRRLERAGQAWALVFVADGDEPFVTLLQRFKDAIPMDQRIWDPKGSRWFVAATPQNEARLAGLFGNFTSLLAAERSQLTLFQGGNPWT